MPVDVFQRDHRVVDHARERQREAGQDHGVDVAAHQRQNHERGHRRDRNRQKHRARGPAAAEEHQDDDADQHQPGCALVQHRVDRFLDENRLVEDDVRDQLFGQVEQVRRKIADIVDHLDGIAVSARLHDRDVSGLLAVDADDVVLKLAGVLRLAHVAHRDPAVAHGLDGNAVEIDDILDQAVGVNVKIGGPDLDIAGGENEVAVVNGIDDIHHAHLTGKKLERIDVNHRLPVFAAEYGGNLRAVDDGNLIANGELRQIVKLGFAESFARYRNQRDGKAGGVEFQHQWRQGPRRQSLEIGECEIGQLRHVRVRVCAGLEVYLDDAYAQQRPGLTVVHSASLREPAFQGIGDIDLDILRRHSGVERRYHHDREIYRREKVLRRADNGEAAEDYQREAQHHDEVGIANGKARHVSLLILSLSLHGLNHGRMHRITRLQTASVALHHHLAFPQAGKHFRVGSGLNAQTHFPYLNFASLRHDVDSRLIAVLVYRLQGDGNGVILPVERECGFGVKARKQLLVGVIDVDLSVHGAGIFLDIHGKARDLAAIGSIERGNLHLSGIANLDIADIRFRNGDNKTVPVVLGKARQRQGLGARTGAGLDKGAKVRVTLRHRAGKGRGDFRIVEENLIVLAFGLCRNELALHHGQVRLCSFDLRLAGEISAGRIVDFLLRHEAGLVFGDSAQAVGLEMQNLVLGLIAAHFLLRMGHLVGGALDRRVILHQLLLQLGNLQNGHQLSLFDAGPVIHQKFAHIAGLLRVNVDFLERNKLGGNGQAARQRHGLHGNYAHVHRRGIRPRIGAGLHFGFAAVT